MVFGCLQWQVIGQMFDAKVLVFDLHFWADVDLDRKHAFESSSVCVEVDQIGSHVSVNPMLMVVAADENSEVVPFAGCKFLYRHLLDHPRLTAFVDMPSASVSAAASASA